MGRSSLLACNSSDTFLSRCDIKHTNTHGPACTHVQTSKYLFYLCYSRHSPIHGCYFSTAWEQLSTFCFTLVSRLYPTPLPRPISIQYSVTWRPTSSLSPCDTTIHLFALGPISVFVSKYTWYECAAGREKQSQNLIEKTYSWTCCTTAMTCQGPLRENEHCLVQDWKKEWGTSVTKRKKRKMKMGNDGKCTGW